jgi:hypothetical protein
MYGRLGELVSTAAGSGCGLTRAFMDRALRLVSVALCKGHGRMYTESLQTLVRSHRRANSPGASIAVPDDKGFVTVIRCALCVRSGGGLSACLLGLAWVLQFCRPVPWYKGFVFAPERHGEMLLKTRSCKRRHHKCIPSGS